VEDVLVNEQGDIQFIVLRLPEGTGDRLMAVDWSMFAPNLDEERLTVIEGVDDLTGVEVDLSSLPADTLILRTEGTDLPEELNNLLRVGSLSNLELQTQAGSVNLGQFADMLLDVQQGQLDFAVVDLSSLMGSEMMVAIPWNQFTIDLSAAADAAQAIGLNVNEETLRNAPTIDLQNFQSRATSPSRLHLRGSRTGSATRGRG
jgi:hypothetical protein